VFAGLSAAERTALMGLLNRLKGAIAAAPGMENDL
jgi:hypothetical protein